MLKEFNRFKKRIQLEFLLTAIGTSLGLGLTIFGILFVCYKREWISLKPWLSALISLGAALILFLAYYLIFRPRDKKIAKRLDKTFQLNEKVQTMIYYQDKDEPILVLQREDTERRLRDITPKKLRVHIPVYFFILLFFGLSSTTASVVVPKLEVPPIIEPEEEDFTLSQWQIEQLEQMIEYVKTSKASDVAKGGYITQLTLLIEKLKESTKANQMKTYVTQSIANILMVYSMENANATVNQTLKATSREKLTLLGESINDYSIEDVSSVIFAIQREYEALEEEDVNKLTAALKADSDALKAQLEITALSKSDDFYIAFDNYQKELEKTESISTVNIMPTVRTALNQLEPKLVALVTETLSNRNVAWYLEDKLRELFGLDPAGNRDQKENGGSSSGDNSDSQMDQNNGGGYGAGDYIFGSSDVLYDYDQNKLVPYGELYDKYYVVINGLINDGSLSEDMIDYINQYLASLTDVKN